MEKLEGMNAGLLECSGDKIIQAACGSARYNDCGKHDYKLWCQRGEEGKDFTKQILQQIFEAALPQSTGTCCLVLIQGIFRCRLSPPF